MCLKGKGRTISLFLHQKCFNVNSSGHKEPQNNHLMLVDVNCDDSVTIPRFPNLVVDLKLSVALKKKKKKKKNRALTRAFWTPNLGEAG